MEHTTLSPPICAKHGCEKTWYKDSGRKAGGAWRCVTCTKEKKDQWYRQNTEHVNRKARAWALAHPEVTKATSLRWNKENAERAAENRVKWRLKNLDHKKEINRQWAQNNPQLVCASSQRRRARKRNATSPLCTVTAAIEAERKALTDGCAFCGADEKLTLEHVVALDDGGLHVPSNLIGSCNSCNCSKRSSHVYEWYSKQPFFSEQRWQRIQQITGDGQLSLI